MATLYLVRGLPGAGKSTLARTITPHVVEADRYFVNAAGEYHFDPTQLATAHAMAQETARALLRCGYDVAVANTFVRQWEMQPYREMPYDRLVVLTIDNRWSDDELARRNVHGVPREAIARMRLSWEL